MRIHGCHEIKLSDSFTRGIPDVLMVSGRVILIEFKIDKGAHRFDARSYKQLGMTGAQDHHVRQISKRTDGRGAYTLAGTIDGDLLSLWVPTVPELEGGEYVMYRKVAFEWDAVWEELRGA